MQHQIIILLLTFCHYGWSFIAIPRLLEEATVSLSPQSNYGGQIQSRFIPLNFGGFGFFQNKPNVKRDVAALQAQVAQLTTDVEQLQAFENKVLSIIHFLDANGINSTSIVNAYRNLPKCPSRASQIGGKRIGSFCYTVSTLKLDFNRALSYCNLLGGTLAEVPNFTEASKEFYNAISGRFPKELGEIAANSPFPGTLWIGYRKETAPGDFVATYSQRTVLFTDNIFSSTDTLQANGAAIEKGGATWVGLGLVDPQLPYICQYFLI